MEYKAKIVSCPNGHYYDAAKHAVCPECSGMQGMPETIAPDSVVGGAWNAPDTQPVEGVGRADGAYSPFGVPTEGPDDIAEGGAQEPVVGWLVCVKGALRGMDFRIHSGYNYIGRDAGDIQIRSDTHVSRQKHAMIAFDSESLLYFFGPKEGRSLVSVNGTPVLNAIQIHSYDVLSIGSSKFLFIGLCGDKFQWKSDEKEVQA